MYIVVAALSYKYVSFSTQIMAEAAQGSQMKKYQNKMWRLKKVKKSQVKAKQRADKPPGYFKDVSLESGTIMMVQWKERISVYLPNVFKQPMQKANKKYT